MFTQTYLLQPEDILDHWIQAWNSGDAIAIANLFVEDAEFVNVVGLWWHDRKAIWKAHDYGLKVIFPESTLSLRKSSVKYVTDEVAVVHGRMKLSGQTRHGDIVQPADRQNLFSFVLQKHTRGWVCISAHNTDIIPGKETNIVDASGEIRSVDYQ